MHIDEDFAQLAVLILTGAQIDLMSAHNCLLRIAPTPLRHFLTVRADHLFDHHFFDDFLCQNRGFLLGRAGGQNLFGFLIIFDKRSGQRLRKFRAIAIQGIGLDPQRPAQFIGCLTLLNGCVIGHIDGFGNCTRDKGLCGGHHIDMAVNTQISLTLFPASIGAIEDAVMLLFQVWCTFQSHCAADMVICRVDIRTAET